MIMISSLTNAKVKHLRRLQIDRRFRQRERQFVVEGTRWLSDLVSLRLPVDGLFYTADWLNQDSVHRQLLAQLDAPTQLVNDEVMQHMSDTETAPGVLAMVPIRPLPLPLKPSLLLILDGVANPGNLGTMLRTAGAAGVDGVLLLPGCVDAYNPKVVRGSMGAHVRLPIQAVSWEELEPIVAGMAVWLADVRGAVAYTAVAWPQPSALIIGNEASGASPQAQAIAKGIVYIPMHAATESLNAAMAAGIILFEAARQRHLTDGGSGG